MVCYPAIHPPSLPAGTLCLVCDKPAREFCFGCLNAPYCSTDCQRLDKRPLHQPLCKDIWDMTLDNPYRPEGSYRVIEFPIFKPHPAFQFLAFQRPRAGLVGGGEIGLVPTWMDDKVGKSPTILTFDCHKSLGRQFDYTIVVMIGPGRDPDIGRTRSMDHPNRSVTRLLHRKYKMKWKGTMVLYGLEGSIKEREDRPSCEEKIRNLDTTCMPALIEFLKVKSEGFGKKYKLD